MKEQKTTRQTGAEQSVGSKPVLATLAFHEKRIGYIEPKGWQIRAFKIILVLIVVSTLGGLLIFTWPVALLVGLVAGVFKLVSNFRRRQR